MSDAVREAVEVLRGGGVISHACEGVWGFACDPFNETAVQRVLTLKQRPAAKGLIVIAHDASQFEPELALLDHNRRAEIELSWPGHTTWVLPTLRFPPIVTGDFATIAASVPAHEQALSLAACFAGPLVSTSANVANDPPCQSEQEVRAQFTLELDYIVPGKTSGAKGPSIIFDAGNGARIR